MRRSTVLPIAALLMFADQAIAQTTLGRNSNPPSSCLAELPTSVMKRVPVYVKATLPDSTPKSIASSADLLVESIAQRVRDLLGSRQDSVPSTDGRLTWLDLDYPLEITIQRSAPLTSHVPLPRERADAAHERMHRVVDWVGSTRGAQLLAEALDSVRKSDEPFFLWPDSSSRDSLTFQVRFITATVDEKGKLEPFENTDGRYLFLAFSVLTPRMSQAVPANATASPSYPAEAIRRGVRATVLTEFVIDTNGRALPETFRDVWKPGAPRPKGEMAAYYALFLDEVRRHVLRSRYKPAAIGGCKVKVLVQRPYEFDIAR